MKKIRPVHIVIIILLVLTGGLAGYKIFVLRYSLKDLVPATRYSAELFMGFSGNGDDVVIKTFLPADEQTQHITGEIMDAAGLDFRKSAAPLYTLGEWSAVGADNQYEIHYSFSAQLKPVRYIIEKNLQKPDTYPEDMAAYLAPTDVIQSDDPLIADIAKKLSVHAADMNQLLRNVFDYVYRLTPRPFKGTTDAVTAAKLGEASCNGKSRLFAAIMRNLNVPARLVGGLILSPGTKRTSHQWLEVFVSGYWIPFDALNNHFAELPDNYLVLYRGDEPLFVHSRNISFDYHYTIRRRSMPNERLSGFLGNHPLNIYNILRAFKRVNIPLDILTFLLTVPLGVLVVVLSRNIIGIKTFGTFLPALMAMAFRETGLLLGAAGFIFVIAVCIVIRYPLNRLGILHTPKLAILMVGVIASMLFLTVISGIIRIEELSSIGTVSLFPIAILTITAERFALTIDEEGLVDALITMAWSLAVTAVCYGVMNIRVLQALMLAFPELLFGVIAINLYIGTWTGLRVSEFIRFRSMYIKKEDGNKKEPRTDADGH